ncbi:MAG: hypothetical protein M3R27_05920 [Bacteroidota bacterium]|nr:hypothetical protein [Bacteroidota bacterium]
MLINAIVCGTEVTPKLIPITGIITAICARYNKLTYEITYYDSGEFKTTWMHESEFTLKVSQSNKIGFNSEK